MNPQELELNKNEDANKMLWSDYQKLANKIHLGGGEKSQAKQRAKGKLTARERVDYLKDKGADFLEIGTFVGYEMYPEHGGCPAGGVVGGITKVAGKSCLIVANDATVKAGAWFPITGKKNLRFQEIALENNLPIIYLVDSAGVFLPMQDEIFPDKEHFGRIFRNNAILSSRGIPQIAAVMGSCVAGGAYLPIMSDEALIVDKTGSIFLAGSYLVKAAIGETIGNEELGGSVAQTDLSGVIDDRFPDDKSCLDRIKFLMDKMGEFPKAGFNRNTPTLPKHKLEEVYSILPRERSKPYESLALIKRLVDNSEFEQYKETYGKTILCGYARIDGWAVGIVANNRELVKSQKGEMQFGGVIYSDSADKAARFIMNCNQKKIPLVFLQDVTGFMVGSRSEQGGIIKDGAKMVNAMSNSTVPKFTIIVGNSYGAGNYAMCGKAYDPRLIVAWPSAKIAVMGGEQAAKVLLQIEKASLAKKGEEITAEREKELLDEIIKKYNKQTTPEYAASRLWVD
ncbi:MAG: acetyl-CoA carboxylase carboxyltransferase component, partial [Bacteroidia bacterium]